jgi:formate-dependent nitrite reductase membrane component NrfD
MKEELIVSGRMNPGIDPYLHIWHWQIPLYLFLGGLAAGILFLQPCIIFWEKKRNYQRLLNGLTLLLPPLW